MPTQSNVSAPRRPAEAFHVPARRNSNAISRRVSVQHLRQANVHPAGAPPVRNRSTEEVRDLGNVSTPVSAAGLAKFLVDNCPRPRVHIEEDIVRDMGQGCCERGRSRGTHSLSKSLNNISQAAAVIPPLHLFEALRRITASQPLHGRARVAGGDPAGVVRRVDAGSPSRRLMGHWHGHCDSRTNESKGVAVGVMQRSVDLPGRLGWRPHARMLEPTEGVEPTTGKLAR